VNRVLAQLSAPAFERLSRHLEPVELPPGARIYEAGSTEDSLYFVGTGIVSLVKVAADDSAVAIAIVGSEGVVGLEMFTGGMIAGWRIVVQSPLRAFRLGADALHRELSLDGELEQQQLRFTEALMCRSATGTAALLCFGAMRSKAAPASAMPRSRPSITNSWVAI
jgi:CRP-like cAMP-binding protein